MSDFIRFAVGSRVIELHTEPMRELKSGRMSPYFFNAGKFSKASALGLLAHGYAEALIASRLGFDVIFGPAYKGIPLAVATALALNREISYRDVEWAADRKETKTHGEGGDMIGADLQGKRVVIIDDVITQGDAKRHAIEFVTARGGHPVAVAIAFDRQERGLDSPLSAAQLITAKFDLPVIAAATTAQLVRFLDKIGGYEAEVAAIRRYHDEYGAVLL